MKVLFVCIGNAGRSQMSEAFFTRAAQDRHEARSAGTQPAAAVHPEVVEAMAELGIDLSARVPHRLERADAEWADRTYIEPITVEAAEALLAAARARAAR